MSCEALKRDVSRRWLALVLLCLTIFLLLVGMRVEAALALGAACLAWLFALENDMRAIIRQIEEAGESGCN